MSLLTDLEGLLHKVQMSQICLADMIHDCKTEAEREIREEFRVKYRFMSELETCLREWRNKVKDWEEKLVHGEKNDTRES